MERHRPPARCAAPNATGAAEGGIPVEASITDVTSLVSAVGVLWIALRLERLAGGLRAVQDDVRSHVNAAGLHHTHSTQT